MSKPVIPTVIATDVRSFAAEDTPQEIIDAIERELGMVVELADMGLIAQRIVEAGNHIAGTFPSGLSRDELMAWMKIEFGV